MNAPVSSPKKSRIKILIVDDHPLLCEGLAALIHQETDLVVCGKAGSASRALRAIAAQKPHLVVVDLTLRSGSGMDLIKDMKLRMMKPSILVLSMHEESLYAERALRAGAQGYMMKQEASKELIKAIRRILKGEIYVSAKMKDRMLQTIVHQPAKGGELTDSLSDRELRVFQLIGQGRATREIAGELCISVKTVESYRSHIKVKMHLRNAHELSQHAVLWVESNHLN